MLASISRLAGFWKTIVIGSLMVSNVGTVLAAPSIQISKPSDTQKTQLQSSDGPRVLQVTPEGGFLQGRAVTVKITFSQSMDRRQTEASFSIQPEVSHKFKWDDSTTLQIQFTGLFAPGTQYALTLISDKAKGSSGPLVLLARSV